MSELKGRVAIVTGAARGIGLAIAEELALAGADIVVIDLALEASEAAAARLRERGVKALGVAANVADAAAVAGAVKQALEFGGRLDILINNAGITRDGLVMRMKDEDWDAVLSVNLKSAFLMCRECARPLMKAKAGRIVNIASIVGEMGNAGQANYAASKAGLIGLTKTLAKEFSSRSITVNAVAPGYIQTDMTAKLPAEIIEKMKALIPLGRLGDPADVARAVRFLASDAASYITGHVLSVNGGMLI